VQLQEGTLRPLRPRSRLQNPVCTGPECDRPSESHDLCREHDSQRRKGQPLHVIGGSWRSEAARRRWERADGDEKERHMALMRAALPDERTELHIQRLSASNRKAWTRKLVGTDRPCRTCGTGFELQAPGQWFCSKDCKLLYARLRRHRLTLEQYLGLIEAQGNRCMICQGEWRGWNGLGPHIDHNHLTGEVRGLLCGECNTGIGRFGDDPALLRRAADYLEGVL
jgi:predicted nucleic acid-binding Zn ribbon protein